MNDYSIEQQSRPVEEMNFDAAESENAAALGWLIEMETVDANT